MPIYRPKALLADDLEDHASKWIEQRKAIKNKPTFPKKSQLYPYLPVILLLIDHENATFQEVVSYLKENYNVKTSRQAIHAYYQRFNSHTEQLNQHHDASYWFD